MKIQTSIDSDSYEKMKKTCEKEGITMYALVKKYILKGIEMEDKFDPIDPDYSYN